ncbi:MULTISPECIES: ABC transporter ATP-binding protein [unclassified Oceanispirochaeta]|uniref:ABC transporter ATP-binding protein n=1 Tax=unclassified Oceanispirochaeta TaxID=2635722 RepID=UPI000E097FF7|nr:MULTISPECIES: ATP-binding cassette domain-containing protein [unclassified Oceanispirochaeta]MBF9018886.1 ATP-binding cassette domain-containing protein [Oceanispirochaeta sp. M2]NPD75381.1 ATP-binding cassette domain-containing protein [Oceanispirochaeta sp. M1]RDG28763.1 ATP-binding cassette domain-containing protein [Oceanispirochaeta sp. M1]
MIKLRNLELSYTGGRQIFDDIDHSFESGKIHGIIGPSGCGKTSLLYLIAGLTSPDRGDIYIHDSPCRAGRRDIAIILQEYGLFPWKTAYENLALGLKIRKRSRSDIDSAVKSIFKVMHLEGMEQQYPTKLSGGERQRLAIGRALILDPEVLLLDEPFSSLDAMTRESLQEHLLLLKQERNLTVLHVTHSIEEAVFLSDKIHIMDGLGRIHNMDNSPQGTNYRKDPDFFSHCVKLRKDLESLSLKSECNLSGERES